MVAALRREGDSGTNLLRLGLGLLLSHVSERVDVVGAWGETVGAFAEEDEGSIGVDALGVVEEGALPAVVELTSFEDSGSD